MHRRRILANDGSGDPHETSLTFKTQAICAVVREILKDPIASELYLALTGQITEVQYCIYLVIDHHMCWTKLRRKVAGVAMLPGVVSPEYDADKGDEDDDKQRPSKTTTRTHFNLSFESLW